MRPRLASSAHGRSWGPWPRRRGRNSWWPAALRRRGSQEALQRALAAIGEGLGWRLGAGVGAAAGRPDGLVCVDTWCAAGRGRRGVHGALAQHHARARRGPARPRVGERGGGLGHGRAGRRQLPARVRRARAGLRAAFCFPLRSARGVLGVVELYTSESRELDAELLATMAMLGDQIGQAVERRRDAEHLRAARTRHQAMLDVALDCVITIDDSGRVLEFNPAAERTFGYSAAEAAGRELADLIVPPELRERHRDGLARYLETKVPAVPRPPARADRDARRRLDLPRGADDHADRPARPGGLRRLRARHHRPQGGRGGAARVARADRRGRRRGEARLERDLHDGAQQRLVELAAGAAHGARADRHQPAARRRSSSTRPSTRSPTPPPSSASSLAASTRWC